VTLTPEMKAGVLAEALPYIRRFRGKVVVVKYGGAVFAAAGAGQAGASAGDDLDGSPAADPESAARTSFAEDIVLMRAVGMLPVVVHGGGPQIGALMARLGKVPEFRDGLRVTDAETLEIARMVLVGKVNREIVGAINVHGPIAVGLSGEDAGLITAGPLDPLLGYVGDVVAVDPSIIHKLVATIGADAAGQAYNINADTVAGAVAEALEAEKLVFLTDVEGVRRDVGDPASLLQTISAEELDELADEGAVGSGMIPKARACASAVRHGVASAHVLDGRLVHVLLLEIFTPEGVGTMVTLP
jgi:acetylglutamate kinase